MKKRFTKLCGFVLVGIMVGAMLLVGCSKKGGGSGDTGNGPKAQEMLGQPGANAAKEQEQPKGGGEEK